MEMLQATVHLVLLDQDKFSVFKVKDAVVKVHTPSATRNTTFFYKIFELLATRFVKQKSDQRSRV
jgi:hypothetical protein